MMPDNQATDKITTFLLPIDGQYLLLPNTSLIEVVSVATMIPVSKKPNWFLGKLGWHGKTVPMIAFNRMDSDDIKLGQFKHGAIIQGGNFIKELPAFAIALSEAPKMLQVSKADLVAIDEPVGQASLAAVEVAGQRVLIPNIAFMEAQLVANLT